MQNILTSASSDDLTVLWIYLSIYFSTIASTIKLFIIEMGKCYYVIILKHGNFWGNYCAQS